MRAKIERQVTFIWVGVVVLFAMLSSVATNAQDFVYVTNSGSDDISAYTIDGTTGALTPVADSPFSAGRFPISVAADPSGSFAYVANFIHANVSAYTIDGTTGALTPVPGSPFPAGPAPLSVAIGPTGKFLYTANNIGSVGSVSAQ